MLPSAVREAARRFGDRVAFVSPDGAPTTYAELHAGSDRIAASLSPRVREGDVVALVLPSSVDYVLTYVALAKLGAITAGVNPRLAPAERAACVAVAGPSLVIVTPQLAVETSADTMLTPLEASHGESPPVLPDDPQRPVAIVFTSGTTGTPRGALFRNRQLGAISQMDAPGDAWGGGGPQLSSTELVHIGSMTKLPWYVRLGNRIHLLGKWRAADALRVIASERIPTVGAISSQIALMLREPDFDRYDWSFVQQIVAGGGPCSPALIREATERFGAPFSVRYSSTESGGLGLVGDGLLGDGEEGLRPRPGIEMEVRDEDGRAVPSGEVGEVWLRTPSAMDLYWQDPDATADTLRDGWVRMGDLGSIDERGLLRLAGRAKDGFVRGGYNVHPAEVEDVLSMHELVRDVAMVGRPDDVMGEIGVAYVVPRDAARPPSLAELRAFADGKLASYKLPEAVRIVDELPLTAMHKVDRRRLGADEARRVD